MRWSCFLDDRGGVRLGECQAGMIAGRVRAEQAQSADGMPGNATWRPPRAIAMLSQKLDCRVDLDLVGAHLAGLDPVGDRLVAASGFAGGRRGVELAFALRVGLEFLNALAESTTDFRQLAGAEDDDNDDEDNREFLPPETGHNVCSS